MGKQRRTDQEKITLARQFEESALTAKQWCKENPFSAATLSAWRKKFNGSEKTFQLLPMLRCRAGSVSAKL